VNCDSENEHQEASDAKGLPPGKAMPPLEGLMEDNNKSGENAYSGADERYDHREGCERIVYLRL
jgi:hypothetical protein